MPAFNDLCDCVTGRYIDLEGTGLAVDLAVYVPAEAERLGVTAPRAPLSPLLARIFALRVRRVTVTPETLSALLQADEAGLDRAFACVKSQRREERALMSSAECNLALDAADKGLLDLDDAEARSVVERLAAALIEELPEPEPGPVVVELFDRSLEPPREPVPRAGR